MRSGVVEVDSARRSLFTRCHMAGLYFHIPFCRRICAYCDFFKSAEVGRVDSVLEAMERELDGAVDWLSDRRIRTVYFGGGTPSLCDPARLQGLADRAAALLDCSGVEEFTVEANPDDMTGEWLGGRGPPRAGDARRVAGGAGPYGCEPVERGRAVFRR